jgi:predicted ATP-grasp superfamily ATP-dependent carboligase
VVGSDVEFYDRARSIGYPAFVKLPTSSGALGIRKVSCYDEAVTAFDNMVMRYKLTEPGLLPILQSFVGGNDYCSTFLFDHGEYRASMTYRNIIDFPKEKGVGVLRETVEAQALEEIGQKLLYHLNWNGVCQIDFRWDGVSEPWLIEVNPRFWGGLVQSIESGWKFPVWMYALATEGHIGLKRPEEVNVRTRNSTLMMLRMIQDFFAARNSFDLGGRIKTVTKLAKEGRGAVNEYLTWDDPFPIFGLAYPLMVLIKHGMVTHELLIGEKGVHRNDKVDERDENGSSF